MQQVVNSPIDVNINSSRKEMKVGIGNTINVPITIKNHESHKIEVDIWINALDKDSQPILKWCEFQEDNKRLAFPVEIKGRSYRNINLKFKIPSDTELINKSYKYEISVEDNVSKIPFRRPQKLTVEKNSNLENQWRTKPEFSLLPLSDSSQPLELNPAKTQEIELTVEVENKSTRVDTFFIDCPHLDKEWFTVKYDNDNLNQRPGLIQQKDGLYLNPRDSGTCTLKFHPPKHTLAGYYSPTVQLTSRNDSSLLLLDVVHLEILPDPRFTVEMNPESQQISGGKVYFAVTVNNQGNLDREFEFEVKDKTFNYTFKPVPNELATVEEQKFSLEVKPKLWKWWLRCFKPKQQEINFQLELKENRDFVSEGLVIPKFTPKLPKGTLIWVSRPWWFLWLLITLALLSLGGAGFFLWNKFLKYRLPPYLEVTELSITKDDTSNDDGKYRQSDILKLNWNVVNQDKFKNIRVKLITLRDNIQIDEQEYNNIGRKSYPFLRCFYNYDSEIKPFKCNAVSHLEKPGKYVHQIEIFADNHNKPVHIKKTDTITVLPHSEPKILSLSTDKPNYSKENKNETASLQWEMSYPGKVKEINVIALKQSDKSLYAQANYIPKNIPDNQDKTFKFAPKSSPSPKQELKCNGDKLIDKTDKTIKEVSCYLKFPQGLEPGDYIFQLAVVPKNPSGKKLEVKKTPIIKVLPVSPPPNPQIVNLSPSTTSYQEASLNESQAQTLPSQIRLNWGIANAQKIKDLKVVGLDSEGNLSWQKRYSIEDLNKLNLCTVGENISCNDVPTNITKAGVYKFDLIVSYEDKKNRNEIVKSTPNIKIQPAPKVSPEPIEILSFQIDGEDVTKNPKRIIKVHREIKPKDITLSWKVKGDDVEVQLLPSPGLVPKESSLRYSPSLLTGSETITLKAKNKKTGEEKIQTLVIQTVDITPRVQTQATPGNSSQQGFPDISNPGNSGNNNQTQPQLSDPNQLPPIELPPQPDSSSRD